MIELAYSLIVALVVALACLWVGLRYTLRRRTRTGCLWMAGAPLALALLIVVVNNSFLNRVLLYHSVNDTVYAAGYNEKGFDSLAIGASMAEIQRALGPPLETYRDLQSAEVWLYYSKHRDGGHSRNYWMKFLVLDAKTLRLKEKVDLFETPL